ncbi:MAG: hypothetical protein IJY70_04465, partial [Clostridia bacterium]|nr:hypothetical protein [Clostridia bacterium]
LIGPFLTKVALQKAGEIDPEGKKSHRQKHERKHRHHRHDDIHELHTEVINDQTADTQTEPNIEQPASENN